MFLSLEKVLRRLNLSHSFYGSKDISVYPFSGFTLANYIKAWHGQKGRKRFFMKKHEREFHHAFPDFVPVSSDD
jgi:hypothetical protein